MTKLKPELEQLTIGTIIDGFNTQAIGMPTLCQRFYELEGAFTEDELIKSLDLYQDIMKTKATGTNLGVMILAVYFILAELVLQRKNHINNLNEQPNDITDTAIPGYM